MTQLDAELHLYQFRMIIKALRNCHAYLTSAAQTNTVAAGWTAETGNTPLNIAFGTTCVGQEEKARMAEARVEFMKILTDTLKNESQEVQTRKPTPNMPGNCPEFLAWPIVCTQIGKYKSLCFNITKEVAYRCCTHCEKILVKLGANNIQIEDLWKTALLSTGEISEKDPWPWRGLMKQEEILKRYGR